MMGWLAQLRSKWKIVVYGQLLSFLVASGGAAQSNLYLKCQISSPTFTVGLYYFCLSFSLLLYWFQQSRSTHVQISREEEDTTSSTVVNPFRGGYSFLGLVILEAPPWVYFFIACFDVYASYCTVAAFKYTSITSVALLTAVATPSTMVLSCILLRRRFTIKHYLGALFCIAGGILNVTTDYHGNKNTGDSDLDRGLAEPYPHKLRGDLLALLGGSLYGANDVLGEMAVRKLGGPNEYIGMLGFFATIICALQLLLLEHSQIKAIFSNHEHCSSNAILGLLALFVLCNVLGYMGGARFFQLSEATFFNLSLQTGSLWSVFFSITAQRLMPHAMFFLSLFLAVAGVVIYEMAPSPAMQQEDIRSMERSRTLRGASFAEEPSSELQTSSDIS